MIARGIDCELGKNVFGGVKYKTSRFILLISLSLLAISSARAQFTGYYAIPAKPSGDGVYRNNDLTGTLSLGNWTSTSTGGFFLSLDVVTNTPNQLYLGASSGVNKALALTIPITTASTVSFNWYGAPTGDTAVSYTTNGTTFNLLTGGSNSTPTTVSVVVPSSGIFGFKIETGPSGTSFGSLNVDTFSVTAVPEPGAAALWFGLPVAGFALMRTWRSRRKTGTAA